MKLTPAQGTPFKPVVAQFKTGVSVETLKRPIAPPVYRPQPTPKVLQTKNALPPTPHRPQPPRQPVAPPVYRPQSSPKVLLPKMTNPAANQKLPVTPRVYAPQVTPRVIPAPKVLQAKPSPVRIPATVQTRPLTPPAPPRPDPIPRVVQTKRVTNQPATVVNLSGIVQLARATPKKKGKEKKEQLERKPFRSRTIRLLRLKRGEHRRHIIPNHLMKHMLQRWWDAHKGDDEGVKTSFRKLAALLDDMNNYLPNLVPGEGRANTAIGMLATSIGGALVDIRESKLSAEEIAAKLKRYRGFAQDKQEELMKGVLRVFDKDKEVKASVDERVELTEDIHGSVDFDWPGGDHWDSWVETYNRFKDIEESPEDFDYEELMSAVRKFESLPEVQPRRDRGRSPVRGRRRARGRRRSESRDERSLSPGDRSASRSRSRSR